MTATMRVPVDIDVDADLDDHRGYILVRVDSPDGTVVGAVRGKLSMYEFALTLARMTRSEGVGMSVDTGFMSLSRERGHTEAVLRIYPDSFRDPVEVVLEAEDVVAISDAVTECWCLAEKKEGGE